MRENDETIFSIETGNLRQSFRPLPAWPKTYRLVPYGKLSDMIASNFFSTAGIYVVAAFAEIGGCFAFWAWLRLDRSPLWLIPGMVSLALFAWLLTFVESDAAGRAFAAYGGVYICASLVWLGAVENMRPDRWNITGGVICLIGALLIMFGPRG